MLSEENKQAIYNSRRSNFYLVFFSYTHLQILNIRKPTPALAGVHNAVRGIL